MASTKLGLFDARRWTGGDDDDPMNFQASTTWPSVSTPVAPVAVMERPAERMQPEKPVYVPTKYKPVSETLKAYTADQLREYSDIAEIVGVAPADLVLEKFKAFVLDAGITVFSLATVVAFMDQKSKAEGRGWGWNWKSLRTKDQITSRFGHAAAHAQSFGDGLSLAGLQNVQSRRIEDIPASDHYAPENGVYQHVVPLHALKKVAAIEKGFSHQVAFMVSDYAPAPAFHPDPFLMVVIPNSRVGIGEGRYVIDVWDEPGFGIEQMLKSDL